MADVTPPTHHGASDGDPGDRGQLLLIAALALAVLFVSLALLLNTAIYSENLATRGSDIAGGQDALRWRYAAQSGIADSMRFVNEHNNSSGHAGMLDEFEPSVEAWDDLSVTHEATAGTVTNVTLLGTTDGTKLTQESTADFTNASGETTWNLSTGTDDSRNFEIRIDDTTAASNPCGTTDCFNVTVDNGTDQWSVTFDETGGGVEVIVEDHTGSTRTCAVVTSFPATFDLTEGVFGDTTCRDYQFGGELTGSYRVTFNNADEVTGTYQVFVAPVGAPVTLNFDEAGDDSDYDALYSATVRLEYHARQVDYVVEYLIEPGGDNE